ncbi:unnamed protein product [Caenorhabditis angaria]|uniref:Uncharacterized protein n=1 Tax=Caenorhabditis angaria TaxID=860376 RepID=A0A9P1IHT8_9PELO|nr:unnamed protein product [Caenorhabditis angaria]
MPKRKQDASSDYKERLKKSNEEFQNVKDVCVSIMHSMGDSDFPLKENEDFVIDVLKNELIVMLEDICKLKKSKNIKTRISICDLIRSMKNEFGLLSRFINYMTKKVEMSQYLKVSKQKTSGSENIFGQEIEGGSDEEAEKEESINEIGELEGEEGELLEKRRKKLMTKDESLLEEVKDAFKELDLDFETFENFQCERYASRQNAILKHIELMSTDSYTAFTESRRISFQKPANYRNTASTTTRKKATSIQSLIGWIGNPPLQSESAEIFLAFFAKEVIGEVVGSALIEKYSEPIKCGAFGMVDDCLEVKHYEEAMRKNEKFRKFSRIFM